MSEQLDTPAGQVDVTDTPNYKAMYEASKAEAEKINGQYTSLQKKHNSVKKADATDRDAEFQALQDKYDALEKTSTDSAKQSLLTQIKNIDSNMAKDNADSDVGTLKTVLKTALGMKSGFPSHENKTGSKSVRDPLQPRIFNQNTGKWE